MNALGEIFYHKINIYRKIEWNNVTQSGSTFATQIRVNSNKVYSEYDNEMSQYSSYLQVKDMTMQIAIEEGDGIFSAQTAGQFNTNASFGLEFDFNSIPIGDIGSLNVSYTQSKNCCITKSKLHNV